MRPRGGGLASGLLAALASEEFGWVLRDHVFVVGVHPPRVACWWDTARMKYAKVSKWDAAVELESRSEELPNGIWQSDGGRYYLFRRGGKWCGPEGAKADPRQVLDEWPWHLLVREDGSHTPVNGDDAI